MVLWFLQNPSCAPSKGTGRRNGGLQQPNTNQLSFFQRIKKEREREKVSELSLWTLPTQPLRVTHTKTKRRYNFLVQGWPIRFKESVVPWGLVRIAKVLEECNLSYGLNQGINTCKVLTLRYKWSELRGKKTSFFLHEAIPSLSPKEALVSHSHSTVYLSLKTFSRLKFLDAFV